jgi:hypothetical protein
MVLLLQQLLLCWCLCSILLMQKDGAEGTQAFSRNSYACGRGCVWAVAAALGFNCCRMCGTQRVAASTVVLLVGYAGLCTPRFILGMRGQHSRRCQALVVVCIVCGNLSGWVIALAVVQQVTNPGFLWEMAMSWLSQVGAATA